MLKDGTRMSQRGALDPKEVPWIPKRCLCKVMSQRGAHTSQCPFAPVGLLAHYRSGVPVMVLGVELTREQGIRSDSGARKANRSKKAWNNMG